MDNRELIVLGAGPGGYAAAFLAADLGIKTTLIDNEKNPGGVCLYRGCIPSKALLHAAKVITDSAEASAFGIQFDKPKIKVDKLREWKDNVVAKLTAGVGQVSKLRKVEYIQGMAKLIDSQSMEIITSGNKKQMVSFNNLVIATGSHPVTLPFLPLDSKSILDSTSALDIKDIPKSMLIIGGGYIGLELGTVYASLGTKITIAEMMPSLLRGVDDDLSSILIKRVNTIFENIMLETKVTEAKDSGNGVSITFETKEGKNTSKNFERVLVSIGRKPNSAGIGLEYAGVEVDERGFIKVDKQLRTTSKNIFAIGDVAGEPMLAHKASHEGRTAVEVIAGHNVAFEPKAIPAVIFTDPEIAYCGLTETEAQKKNMNITVAKFPWGASGRAITLGRTDGLTKLIIDSETERILGGGIVGPGAGDLVSEIVLAVEMGANATDIKLSIHPHPTLSETIMESAEVFFGQSTHVYKPVKK